MSHLLDLIANARKQSGNNDPPPIDAESAMPLMIDAPSSHHISLAAHDVPLERISTLESNNASPLVPFSQLFKTPKPSLPERTRIAISQSHNQSTKEGFDLSSFKPSKPSGPSIMIAKSNGKSSSSLPRSKALEQPLGSHGKSMENISSGKNASNKRNLMESIHNIKEDVEQEVDEDQLLSQYEDEIDAECELLRKRIEQRMVLVQRHEEQEEFDSNGPTAIQLEDNDHDDAEYHGKEVEDICPSLNTAINGGFLPLEAEIIENMYAFQEDGEEDYNFNEFDKYDGLPPDEEDQ